MYQEIKYLNGKVLSIKKIATDGQDLFIPLDPANTDYQAYLAWCAKGNTPLPAEEQV